MGSDILAANWGSLKLSMYRVWLHVAVVQQNVSRTSGRLHTCCLHCQTSAGSTGMLPCRWWHCIK